MVADYPHRVASRERFQTEDEADRADDGLGTRVLMQVRQTFCGMHGHDALVQFEQDRMFLKCVSCGHESPGWDLERTRPAIRPREERRPALSPRLVGVRRIA